MIKVNNFIKNEKIYKSDNFIDNPIISVMLPTYCRGDNGLLERAINSVLSQTFGLFELIIIDDGSIDGTQKLVKKYLELDNRIMYIRNDENSGIPAIRVNQGILHSRGKYLAYQFDDDQWYKYTLEYLYNEIENRKELSLVYGQWEVHDVKTDAKHIHKNEFSYSSLIKGNFIANNSVLHHKDIIHKYGMYDCHLTMRRLCDWDLWIRWAKEVPFIYVDKVVSYIEMMVDGSLGDTVTYDLDTSRVMFGYNRNESLTPENIKDYIVDSLDNFGHEYQKIKVYNKHILPWKINCTNFYNNDDTYKPNLGKKQRVIVTKFEYDCTVNIMIENYTTLCQNDYLFIYIPEEQLEYDFFKDNDILLLCRATTQDSLNLSKRLKDGNKNVTILYFMDDDLLNIYKLGNQFEYIAPGSQMYNNVTGMLSVSDNLVAFSYNIAESIKLYNNKVTVLQTNILSKFLSNEDAYNEENFFRIVFMGGASRREEFEEIQDDLVHIAEKYGDRVKFSFWGFIPEKMKILKSINVEYIEYTTSYYQYLNRLSNSKFNLLICPLNENYFNKGKSPIKLLEACCCGAIGLYSDVSVYDCIKDGTHGFKISRGESWFKRIDKIIQMPEERKKEIFNNALKMVRDNFTTSEKLIKFKMALKSAELANKVKDKAILYVSHSAYLAGAENHLFRHCLLSKQEGIKVIFALPEATKGLKTELYNLLASNNIDIIYLNYVNYCEIEDICIEDSVLLGQNIVPAIQGYSIVCIHSCTLIPAMGYAAKVLNIPYIASLYQTETGVINNSNYELCPMMVHSDSIKYANLWQDKLGAIARCIRSYVPMEFFRARQIKAKNMYRIAISGTVQKRKGQLELIEAIGLLKNTIELELYIFGYDHFFPDYKDSCINMAKKYKIEERIHWKGLIPNIHEQIKELDIDILVCASTSESFPQVILEAMALEVAIVTTPVGGVLELIKNNITGFVTKGCKAEQIADSIINCVSYYEDNSINTILNNSKKVLIKECSYDNVVYNLFDLYLLGIGEFEKSCNYTSHSQCYKNNDENSNLKLSKRIDSNVLSFSGNIMRKRKYDILCNLNEISEIGLIFHSKSGISNGNVTLKIFVNGRLIRKVKIPIESIIPNDWSYFKFNNIYGCGGKIMTLEVDFEYMNASDFLGVYEDRRNRTFIYKVFNKLKLPLKGLDVLYVDYR